MSQCTDERVCVTIISFEEQMRGWMSYIAASRTIARQVEGYARLRWLIQDYRIYELLDFDAGAADHFERLRRAKVKVASMDLKMAAIALTHDATLVTRNTVHFKLVPGLRIEYWTIPQ